MRVLPVLLCLGLASPVTSCDVLSLDSATFNTKTSGKTVFIKFFAPWCVYCKRLAPDWEKLANEWEGHEVGLIAEVDCTSRSGKILCERFDIRSFPTLMYGDPGNLEEYEGSRKYEDLVEFARQNLVPLCSPTNLDLCSEEARSQIERYLAMSKDELQALVEAEENKLVEAKKKYDQEIEALQLKYEEAAQERDEALAAIREGGLEWMKSVSKAMNENSQRLTEAKTDEL